MRVKDVSDGESLVTRKLQKVKSSIFGGYSAVLANCCSPLLVGIMGNFDVEVLLER